MHNDFNDPDLRNEARALAVDTVYSDLHSSLAETDRRSRVAGRLREHHRVRRLIGNPGRGIAVLLAYGTRGNEAIAESRGQCRNHGVDGALIATQVFCILVHGYRPGQCFQLQVIRTTDALHRPRRSGECLLRTAKPCVPLTAGRPACPYGGGALRSPAKRRSALRPPPRRAGDRGP